MTKTCPAIVVLAFTAACLDQALPDRAVGLAARDAAATDRMIMTPLGPRPASTIHQLARGHGVRLNDRHVQEVDSKGTVFADFAGFPSPPMDSGDYPYETSDSLRLPPADTAVYLETHVVVPAPPTDSEGNQLIFLWEGLALPESSLLVQPVLQWGYTGRDGGVGGNYWSASCWYVGYGQIFLGAPAQVNLTTGETLSMFVGNTSGSHGNGKYTYTCFAGTSPYGVGDTTDSAFGYMGGTPLLPVVIDAMEVYSNNYEFLQDANCLDYPNQDSLAMTDIAMYANGSFPAYLKWSTPMYYDNACGQRTVVVDSANSAQPSGGELDLYFRLGPPSGVTIGQMEDGEVPCLWIGGPAAGGEPPLIYSWWSSDFGVFEVDTTANTQDTVGWYDPYIPPATDLTVSLTVTDEFQRSASNSDYVTGYDCSNDESPRKGRPKVTAGTGGAEGSVARRLP